MNASDFFALPQEERYKILSEASSLNINMNGHTVQFVRSFLEKIEAGEITVLESSIEMYPNKPGIQCVTLKLKDLSQ